MRQLTCAWLALVLAWGCGGSIDEESEHEGLPLGTARSALSLADLATDDLTPEPLDPDFAPLGLEAAGGIVVVRLAGDPISVVQSRTPERRLTAAERAALRAEIVLEQAPVRAQVESLGGRVRFAYQHAYNGLAITVPQGSMPELRSLSGITGVFPARRVYAQNSRTVPYLGAPQAWQSGSKGYHGERVKVAVIDSGIDYTHAGFGGPGTAAAYASARASEAAAADPQLFGPRAARVKGGIDLVGDAYDAASADPTRAEPVPDANPLDCEGHGSHVAGTLAGSGVTLDGSTYRGRYDERTLSRAFAIAPGVAPRADLYALRVLGCAGTTSTDLILSALEWAMDNDMDVVNMSLGGPFAGADAPDSIAASNAVRAGITVVASAGNEGPGFYIAGAPGSGDGVISVGAIDVNPSYPGARLESAGGNIDVTNANGASFVDGELRVVVLGNGTTVGLGCTAQEYGPQVAGALVVSMRGVCTRNVRAQLAQAAGAVAIAMINTDATWPPFQGAIPGVSIPFLGVRSTDGARLRAAPSVRISQLDLQNPDYRRVATFSSGGPRNKDSALLPSLVAPGVGVVSVAVGSGNAGVLSTGTSMSAPAVAGLAALTRQAHPRWSPQKVAAALVNTADPALVDGYSARLAGAGVPQAEPATRTRAVVSAGGAAVVNFGFIELERELATSRTLTLYNDEDEWVSFAVTIPEALRQGFAHVVGAPARVRVRPHSSANFELSLSVTVPSNADPLAFNDLSGMLELTPERRCNGGVTLRIPYYAVVRPEAKVAAGIDPPTAEDPTGSITLANASEAVFGSADFFNWGLEGQADVAGCNDIRAAGVQSRRQSTGNNRVLVFAINAHRRCSNSATNEYDVLLTNASGQQFVVAGFDEGQIRTGIPNGVMVTVVLNRATGARSLFPATARTDSATVLLFTLASTVGVTPTLPRFSYALQAFSLVGEPADSRLGPATFNAYAGSLTGVGGLVGLTPGTSTTVPVSLDATEWALTPSKGFMLVLAENAPGASQAALLPVSIPALQPSVSEGAPIAFDAPPATALPAAGLASLAEQ